MPPRDVMRMEALIGKWTKSIRSRGYQKYSFPLIGCWSDFKKESETLALEREVYRWEDQGFVAPTGQMIMYPLLYQDPRRREMRYYQVGPVFRKESEACRYLLRHKEVRYFYELHALFPTQGEALAEFKYLEKKARKFLNSIGLAHRAHYRTPEDRFPGSKKTLALDTVLKDGRALQLLTLHHLGTNFSEPIGGKKIYQICLGFTERLLGGLKDHYGTDLRQIDNPYQAIRLRNSDIKHNTTLKKVAENHEEFFENKYSVHNKVIRHVKSGEIVGNSWRRHSKDSEMETKSRVMAQANANLNKHLSKSNDKHCLGYSATDGQKYYVRNKV